MTGLRPDMIWAFLAVPAAALLAAAHFRWKRRTLPLLGDPSILLALVDPLAGRRQRLKAALAVAALACLAAALWGPQWGRGYETARRRGADVMIAVDVSDSMLAEDVAPDRLTQAKRALGRVIDGAEGDRVGVVVFAGAAVMQCPLTLDRAAARSLLDLVETGMVPVPGTDLGAALGAALDAFPEGRRQKAVVLLTDGDDRKGGLEAAAARAAKEGARVFVIGLGSPAGEVIPVKDAQGRVVDYRKDKSGKTVVSKLGEAALQDLAARTGGTYARATPGEAEIDRLIDDLKGLEKRALEDRSLDRGRDRAAWPLAAALAILFLEFFLPERRAPRVREPRDATPVRGKSLAALLLALWSAASLRAAEPAAKPESRDVRLWRQQAEKRPEDPETLWNLGHALFSSGDAAGAAQAFERAKALAKPAPLRAAAAYNAGTAGAAAGKTDEAIERYKDALRADPSDADAKFNYEFLARQKKKGGGGGKDKDGKGKPEETAAAPRPGALSKEDAERILQAVERQEKDARQKDKMPPAASSSEDDW